MTAETLAYLRSPRAIRDRARALLARAEGGAGHFAVVRDALPDAARRVAEITRSRFPDLHIPYHSRWNHFRVGGLDRTADLMLSGVESFDLLITSVLLDAGAGPAWQFREAATGLRIGRSEGLALASLQMFLGGGLSSDPHESARADADGLARIDAHALASWFQVHDDNPLVGLEGRAQLMQRLGEAVRARPDLFPGARVGGLFQVLRERASGGALPATEVLTAVLDGLETIWPGRVELDGHNLGDVWPHAAVGLVPLHKLSQWLSYSLIDALERAGVRVERIDELTPLAEYRNGGLLIDTGVLAPRTAEVTAVAHRPDSEVIVEWRALTVALIEELAERVRAELERPDLPLPCILEGGTWAAGRVIAGERRENGAPPIRIDSDGTVF